MEESGKRSQVILSCHGDQTHGRQVATCWRPRSFRERKWKPKMLRGKSVKENMLRKEREKRKGRVFRKVERLTTYCTRGWDTGQETSSIS